MRTLGSVLLAASLATAATATASPYVSKDLTVAKAMTATGSPFSRALHAEYTALADEALKESDHLHARRYVDKALAAGDGRDVVPEDPTTWWLPRRSRGWLVDSHVRLTAALAGGGRESGPQAAARAQAMFDCWVEEEHEDIWARAPGVDMYQPQDIERCRSEFLLALQVLAGASAERPAIPVAPIVAPQPAPLPPPAIPTELREFTIFFAFDNAELDRAAMSVVAEIAAVAPKDASARVSIFGHADRAGPVEYNLDLSRRRAAAVVEALSRLGIARDRMVSSSFGESRPMVVTPDGVAHPRNRRAEITVQ